MIDYSELGAKEIIPSTGENYIRFGILLPGIKGENYRLTLNCVREQDFYNDKSIIRCEMEYDKSNTYDLWQYQLRSSELGVPLKSTVTFIYWYTLKSSNDAVIQDYIPDPFAREFGFSKFSAFTVNYQKHQWSDYEVNWQTPEQKNCIVYELHINEFGKDIDGCIQRLPYLKNLGINCIEIMPVNNTIDTVNWGYLPLGHFGVDERFGNRKNFQVLIDVAHQNGIAVIMDVVFGHTALEFTFFDLYYRKEGNTYINRLPGISSPLNTTSLAWGGSLVNYGPDCKFTLDYFEAVMHNLYDNYHVDGFRFDCVSEFLDGYKVIVNTASELVNQYKWSRFSKNAPILAAEYLTDKHPPQYVLTETKSNCCVQNNTFDVCKNLAVGLKYGDTDKISASIFNLGQYNLSNHWYPSGKMPFVNIQSHDHMRFICNFFDSCDPSNKEMLFGEYKWNYEQRLKYWFKVQPFLIGIILSRGIPFIWQGDELIENYYVNEDFHDISRIKMFRDVHWEYFFDFPGKKAHDLVKLLIETRKKFNFLFIDGTYQYIDDMQHRNQQVLAFKRVNNSSCAFVVLNFSDQMQTVTMPENIQKCYDIIEKRNMNHTYKVTINSNYGCVLIDNDSIKRVSE